MSVPNDSCSYVTEEVILVQFQSQGQLLKKSPVSMSVELMLKENTFKQHYVASDELEQEMLSNLIMQMVCRIELMIIAMLSR